jgi:ATP-dependent HslUV protease subunit HslV
MTTIACDGKSMAGDGRSRDAGGLICSESIAKVRRLKDGRIFGLAGNPYDLNAIEAWLNDGGEFPQIDKDNFDLLVLEADGRAYSYSPRGGRSEQLLPAGAGSGIDLAIGAMEAGASAEEAVRIACKRHAGSGGKITVLHRA